jgi:hypothetical protein
VIRVPSITFAKLCEDHNVTRIDYLNIDTEGAEYDIIASIDFSKIRIHVISVENNYVDNKIHKILSKNGFKLVTVAGDEIYLNTAFALGSPPSAELQG